MFSFSACSFYPFSELANYSKGKFTHYISPLLPCFPWNSILFFPSKHAWVSQTLDCIFLCRTQKIGKQTRGQKCGQNRHQSNAFHCLEILASSNLTSLRFFPMPWTVNFLIFFSSFLYIVSEWLILVVATVSFQSKEVPASFYSVFIIYVVKKISLCIQQFTCLFYHTFIKWL